jgi:beta-lactamase class D
MIKKNIITGILVVFSIVAFSQNNNPKAIEIQKPEWNAILEKLKVKGAILIYDPQKNTYYSNNFHWTKTGMLPASTFKIPNSIIALETGVIKNDSVVFKWNGEKRRMKKWEQDLTFKQAFQVSCVPCYQEIARKVGVKRMKFYLKKLDYPGMVFDTLTIDNFWLEGKSKISLQQQIHFLERLYFSKHSISKSTVKILKDIMLLEKTESYTLSGKTGWGMREEMDNGWIVGYLETNNLVYFFATNVEMKNATLEQFSPTRINATKEAFRKLKLLE